MTNASIAWGRSALHTNDTAAFSWGRNNWRAPNFRVWGHLPSAWLSDRRWHWAPESPAWLQTINCAKSNPPPPSMGIENAAAVGNMGNSRPLFFPFIYFLGKGEEDVVEIKPPHFAQISQLCWKFQSPALWSMIPRVLFKRQHPPRGIILLGNAGKIYFQTLAVNQAQERLQTHPVQAVLRAGSAARTDTGR